MKILILFFVFLTFLSCQPNAPSEEAKIFEIRKGTNLGVWLSQTDSRIRQVEPEEFIMKNDIEEIAAMGFDHRMLGVSKEVLEESYILQIAVLGKVRRLPDP